jgi:hypothetical protein
MNQLLDLIQATLGLSPLPSDFDAEATLGPLAAGKNKT